jgi:hypothetical protein
MSRDLVITKFPCHGLDSAAETSLPAADPVELHRLSHAPCLAPNVIEIHQSLDRNLRERG